MKAQAEADAQVIEAMNEMGRKYIAALHNVQFDQEWMRMHALRWRKWSGNDENYGRMAVAT